MSNQEYNKIIKLTTAYVLIKNILDMLSLINKFPRNGKVYVMNRSTFSEKQNV